MVTSNVDERREPLYDTLTAVKQTTVKSATKMFIVGTDTKGLNVTNVSGNGELPSPERMTVLGIRIDFADTPNADILGLTKNLMLRLVVSGKSKILAPLNYFNSGMANTGNGVADARAIVQFPDGYQIDIESGEKFYAELVGADYLLTDVTTGLSMRVLLDGLHSVPVN
jgi:hypothetical protein